MAGHSSLSANPHSHVPAWYQSTRTFWLNAHCPFLERNSVLSTDTWKSIFSSWGLVPGPADNLPAFPFTVDFPPHSTAVLTTFRFSHVSGPSLMLMLLPWVGSSSQTFTFILSFCKIFLLPWVAYSEHDLFSTLSLTIPKILKAFHSLESTQTWFISLV